MSYVHYPSIDYALATVPDMDPDISTGLQKNVGDLVAIADEARAAAQAVERDRALTAIGKSQALARLSEETDRKFSAFSDGIKYGKLIDQIERELNPKPAARELTVVEELRQLRTELRHAQILDDLAAMEPTERDFAFRTAALAGKVEILEAVERSPRLLGNVSPELRAEFKDRILQTQNPELFRRRQSVKMAAKLLRDAEVAARKSLTEDAGLSVIVDPLAA